MNTKLRNTPFVHKFKILLLMICTFIYVISLTADDILDVRGSNILDGYPCNNTDAIFEIFDTDQPTSYKIYIDQNQLDIDFMSSDIIKIILNFDSLADIKENFKYLSLYSDSYSTQAMVRNDTNKFLMYSIQPRKGKPFPNLKNVIVNKAEFCNLNEDFVGYWDQFLPNVSTTINVTQSDISTTLPSLMGLGSRIKIPSSDSTSMCGRRIIEHQELIYGGKEVKPGTWPWHAAIYRLHTVGDGLKYTCGGSLISKTRILTAGHCIMDRGSIILAERLVVILGKTHFLGGDIGQQEKTVFDIILHPSFTRETLLNDIALLKLSTEVTFTDFVQPVCFWGDFKTNKYDIIGSQGHVVGWGATELYRVSLTLKETVMPVVSDLICIKNHPNFFAKFLTEYSFCAGFANGSGACNGDSGGGLFIKENDSWFLRGITSLAVSKKNEALCDPNYYTIFTDIAQYLDFIKINL